MRISLGTKLVFSHLCVGLIPLLFISFFLWMIASNELEAVSNQGVTAVEEAAYHQLKAMREIKEKQIASFFSMMEGQMYMAKDSPWLLRRFVSLNKAFTEKDSSANSSIWQGLIEKYDSRFKKLCDNFDWHNIFLINSDGNIIYSMNKEGDLGFSLNKSPLRSSSLGKAFAALQKNKDINTAFGDYAPYAPLHNEPSAFLITRMETNEVTAYLAVQPSLGALKNMIKMGSRKSHRLEAYLVGMDGYMRSDSVLDPENYSRVESFRQGNKGFRPLPVKMP